MIIKPNITTMNKIFCTVTFTIIAQIGFAQLTTETLMQFKYKDIPFGKDMSEITKLIPSEVNIEKPEDVNIEDFYGFVAIRNYFKKGIYSYFGMGSYFANYSVTKQILTNYSGWNNIKTIELYYTKQHDSEVEPTLFLVRKVLTSDDGNLTNVFNGLQSAISKQLVKVPKILNSNFIYNTGNYVDSKIAIWDTGTNLVFLMVTDNVFSRHSEFLYVSKTGLNKYFKSVETYEKRKELEEKNKANKSANEF